MDSTVQVSIVLLPLTFIHNIKDPNQQTKTIARALKALWASYWNIEAFEERA